MTIQKKKQGSENMTIRDLLLEAVISVPGNKQIQVCVMSKKVLILWSPVEHTSVK